MTRSFFPALWNDKTRDTHPLTGLQREVDRVFDEFSRRGDWPFRSLMAGSGTGKMMPRIDVSETDKDIEVTAELPGVDEKDIELKLAEDVLTIRGEKKSESEKKDKDYHLVERSYGSFERSVRLPTEVKSDKVKATFVKGVLHVTMPKSTTAKDKSRKIEISAG